MDSKIIKIQSRAIPVPGNDLDTDRIMPARYLRCVTFDQIGQYCFQDERFDQEGNSKDHSFNDSKFKGAEILLTNKNFGCGSSREHAPQGILRWGIKAIIGESFAEIFAGNCTAIGLPVVTAQESDIQGLMAAVQENPETNVEVDIKNKKVSYGGNKSFSVDMKESSRKMFLEGTWDSTSTLLSAKEKIDQLSQEIPYLNWK